MLEPSLVKYACASNNSVAKTQCMCMDYNVTHLVSVNVKADYAIGILKTLHYLSVVLKLVLTVLSNCLRILKKNINKGINV